MTTLPRLLLTSALLTCLAHADDIQQIKIDGSAPSKRFDGIGLVNGGGATSVLLKDYPEPQRSQILDLVFKPKFGASISALLVEIPGDGNSTQGSMPSHMRTRDDLDYSRGYTWWLLSEAAKRNPDLSLDGTAWSAPGWIGDGKFWSQDAADYYVTWLQGLRDVYGLEFAAIGCRNEKGVSKDFAKMLRATLDARGFSQIRIHAFDDWPDNKFDFVPDLLQDPALDKAVNIIGAHVMYGKPNAHASKQVQTIAAQLGKPIWNTEDHVYKKGFDCEISIVQCFNHNFIYSGATRIVNWYDIAGIYPLEPYAEDPATILAHSPWSGHYRVREALWGYAHYGQFTEAGWAYITDACGELSQGGSYVTLKSPRQDYSVIIETKDARKPQTLRLTVTGDLSRSDLVVWRSDSQAQFVQQPTLHPVEGVFTLTLAPDSIYSLSTTTGQQKGTYGDTPPPRPFPFPYHENFESYTHPEQHGHLPHYFADIEEVFELAPSPDGHGRALQQVIPRWPITWAPSWKPYTIIGDENWQDYEVSATVYLNPGDTAGVMGRINHVGTGYGTTPKGYFLQLRDDGLCELVIVRGKIKKQALVGDAEQQALIKKTNDASPGGEAILATAKVPNITPKTWHRLTLCFQGQTLTGLVDGQIILTIDDPNYSHGMAGLLAGTKEGKSLSTPYYDDIEIRPLGTTAPASPAPVINRPAPLYPRLNAKR